MKPFAWLAVGAALLTSTAAVAQGGPHPVRGVVTAVTADSLTLTGTDGKPVVLALTPTWIVSVMQPIAADAIQPGSFIGSAEMPQADGNGRSLEVHIFPPGVKMGEGHYAWDLQPGAMMTNGTVGKVVASANGRELDVSYPTGTRHLVVPPGVPIVQITPGDRAMVKPGAHVFAVAAPNASGVLTAGAVATGPGGAAPPM